MLVKAKIGCLEKENLTHKTISKGDVIEVLSFSHFFDGEAILLAKLHYYGNETFLISNFFIEKFCEEIDTSEN